MAESTGQVKQRKPRKTMIGVVTTANKTPKTIAVKVPYMTRHAKYGKFLRQSRMLKAHDEGSVATLGDQVEVMECRPVSKTKRWRLVRVVQAAPQD